MKAEKTTILDFVPEEKQARVSKIDEPRSSGLETEPPV